MAELSVILKGKIDDLKKDLKEAKKLLSETGEAAEKSGKKIDNSGEKATKGVSSIDKAAQSMISSFIGPGGVVVAIGAVVSAIALLNERGNKISKSLEFIAGGIDAVTEAEREFTKETTKGIGAATAQIAVLDELINLAKDETRATNERQEAIDRLNKKYQDQLGFLDLEKVKTESVEKARLKLGEALIREAKIRGAQSLIAKETEKILEEESKSAIDAANGWDILFAALKNGQTIAGGAGIANDIITSGLVRQRKEITKSEDKITALTEKLRTLLGEDLTFDRITAKDPVSKEAALSTLNFTEDELARRFGLDDVAQSKLEKKAAQTSSKISKAIAKDLDASPVSVYTSKIEDILVDFNENASQIIEGSIANTFSGIGQAIGNALSDSANVGQALGKALLGSIGSILVQLGELAISTGIGILAINTALKSLNPYVAIAAGVALVALGSLVSSSAAKIGSSGGTSAGTSSVSGQGSSSNSFSGGSSSNLSASTGGEFVFRIRGRELIGVIENELSASRRLGGIGTIGG